LSPHSHACVLPDTQCPAPLPASIAPVSPCCVPAIPLEQLQAALGDARLVSVCFYGHFSMRCRVENLHINLPLTSAQTRQPALRRLESVSGPRRDVHYMRTSDGHHLYAQIYRSRIWRLCLEGDAPCLPLPEAH